jgi:hypothetical protein
VPTRVTRYTCSPSRIEDSDSAARRMRHPSVRRHVRRAIARGGARLSAARHRASFFFRRVRLGQNRDLAGNCLQSRLDQSAQLRLSSPQRAGRGPQFPRATAWLRAATQAPFCGLLLRSPQRAGRGPQFPRATAWLRAATQAPFCGLLLRSAKGAARTPESIQEPIAPRSVLREVISRLCWSLFNWGATCFCWRPLALSDDCR